ncbi:MAG: succinate dehydrogenase [Isosphaeraceae bacterium]|nr:succinate dehydrogenase [Isosphaeraceae bacterium]
MSQTLRPPRNYRRGLRETIVEGLRYSGGVGQRSWLIHRITGLGVLAFLVIHIIDTFFVVAYPALYDHTVAIYGGVVSGLGAPFDGYYWPLRWLFRVAELGLIACVLFHSVNGVRVVLFDFWPRAVSIQKQIYTTVIVIFWAVMIPVTIWVLLPLLGPPAHAMPKVGLDAPAPILGLADISRLG